MPLRAGDMPVLHNVWLVLPQIASNHDFIPVADYPKAEQRQHKFKNAMVIFAIALSSRIPASVVLVIGAVAC